MAQMSRLYSPYFNFIFQLYSWHSHLSTILFSKCKREKKKSFFIFFTLVWAPILFFTDIVIPMPTLFNDHCKLSGWISDRNLTCPDTPRAVTVQIRSPHPSAGYNDSDDEQRCRTITMTTVKAPYLAAQRACLIKSRRVGRENSHPTGSSAFQ